MSSRAFGTMKHGSVPSLPGVKKSRAVFGIGIMRHADGNSHRRHVPGPYQKSGMVSMSFWKSPPFVLRVKVNASRREELG